MFYLWNTRRQDPNGFLRHSYMLRTFLHFSQTQAEIVDEIAVEQGDDCCRFHACGQVSCILQDSRDRESFRKLRAGCRPVVWNHGPVPGMK